MKNFVRHKLLENHFLLTTQKCIFWEEEKSLIVSDMHLGKAGHFRKSGIGIPQNIFLEDLHRVMELIHFFNPKKIIVVGDFFHSSENKEHQLFEKWRNGFNHIDILLIKGNHDILSQKRYEEIGIQTMEQLQMGNFRFQHDLCNQPEKGYCFSGHIHPGITLRGKGKQSLRFPCYFFSDTYAILPAFGKFTGTVNVSKMPSDHVYIITNDCVMPLSL